MPNSNLTIDMITNEVLRVAHEKAAFIGTINRQFDDAYGKEGAKIGSALRIRLPDQYLVTSGRAISNQDSIEQSTTMTMATQKNVAMKFNSAELYTDIDDFSKRKIVPAVSAIISDVENDVLQGCTKLTYNLAGTAGTALTDLTVPGAARAKLNQGLAPKDGGRSIQMDSVTMGGLVNGLKGLFQDSAQIKEQYREGFVTRTAMADYYENERVWTMPNSADVVGQINAGTLTDGITSLTVDGLTAAPVAGMVFTILGTTNSTASIKMLNPETKAAYGHAQQFVCAAGCTTTNLVFTPPIYWDSANPKQNVSRQPADNDDITFAGLLSTNYPQSLMYHQDAFAFVTGELPLMAGADRCVRKTVEGLSMRVWTDSDIRNDEQITRIDILYGYAAIRPAWACRMIGAVAA